MTISPYIGAYWGPRQESLDACADRAVKFLEGISSAHPALSTWYQLGVMQTDALQQPAVLERGAVLTLLESGRNRRESDRSVIEELGYSINLWNGQDPSVGLNIGCGRYHRSEYVKNAVVIDLPRSDEGLADLALPERARAMMHLLVECWDPDWATWTSSELRREQRVVPGRPVLGWMTYLSSLQDPQPSLLARSTLEPLGPGSLITAADEITEVTGASLLAIREALAGNI
jgi:Immunity protein 52